MVEPALASTRIDRVDRMDRYVGALTDFSSAVLNAVLYSVPLSQPLDDLALPKLTPSHPPTN